MTRVRMTFASLIVTALLVGCTNHYPCSTKKSVAGPDDFLIVPGHRVGRFVIGQDTLASILGSDTSDARRRFAEKGLYFEFEQGKELKGITVTSPDYVTPHGFRVGTSGREIYSELGAPASCMAQEVHGKFAWPALSYPGVLFLLREGTVRAIRIGSP